MNSPLITAARTGLICNILLFVLKLTAGLLSNSIAVISDALNSLTDIITSIAIHISIKLSSEAPDKDHPFGHQRAEPVAGLLVAIMSAILGVSVISNAIGRFGGSSNHLKISSITFIALTISILVKFCMAVYFHKICKIHDSPAIKASEIDSRSDVLASLAALAGIIGVEYDLIALDSVMATLIGFQIIATGYEVGKRNIDFLIGKAPDDWLIDKIKSKVANVPEVKGYHDIRAHYVGNIVQVEIHIILDKNLRLIKAHSIGKNVQQKVESIESIDKAFIHIDTDDWH